METEVLKANEGLVETVKSLQAQMAVMEKKLELCQALISEFGHFVPSVVCEFKYEMKKLDADDTDQANGDQLSDMSEANL